MTFKILSVAENGGVSDTIAAESRTYHRGITTVTKIEISEKGRTTIGISHGAFAISENRGIGYSRIDN
jgi:hypothetical protein